MLAFRTLSSALRGVDHYIYLSRVLYCSFTQSAIQRAQYNKKHKLEVSEETYSTTKAHKNKNTANFTGPDRRGRPLGPRHYHHRRGRLPSPRPARLAH